jgi:hypothetical protein
MNFLVDSLTGASLVHIGKHPSYTRPVYLCGLPLEEDVLVASLERIWSFINVRRAFAKAYMENCLGIMITSWGHRTFDSTIATGGGSLTTTLCVKLNVQR